MRFLIAAFFVAHGLVHAIMFGLTYSSQARADLPFNPSRSWLIGEVRTFGFASAIAVTVAFVIAAGGYLARADWSPTAALVAAAMSVVLLLLFFSRWWLIGIVISLAVAIFAWRSSSSG